MKKTIILLAALFLVGCGQATNGVSQLELETVNQEEVQKTEETKEEKEAEEAEEEDSQTEVSSSQDVESAGEHLNAQPEDVQKESVISESEPEQVSVSSETEEDLAYDGDLGDSDLYPNQPMFIDGVLHSGDTSGVAADMIVTADELRASGYTVYELSYEDYERLMQDINNSVIPYEEAMSHYFSNY